MSIKYTTNGAGATVIDEETGFQGGRIQIIATADIDSPPNWSADGVLSLEVKQGGQDYVVLNDYERTTDNITRVNLKSGSVYKFSHTGTINNLLVDVI